jgi:Mrp family chromosome partitioning ATPase
MIRRQKKVDHNSSQGVERNGFSEALVAIQDPAGAVAEAYRMLRTNLFYARVDTPPKVIVLTSAGREEGKSITVANLGVMLAQAGKNTLILDCDLRKPAQHKILARFAASWRRRRPTSGRPRCRRVWTRVQRRGSSAP